MTRDGCLTALVSCLTQQSGADKMFSAGKSAGCVWARVDKMVGYERPPAPDSLAPLLSGCKWQQRVHSQ